MEKSLYKREASGWFKGLAIIMVILSHYAEWWSWFHVEEGISEIIRYGVSRFGPYGVGIFFLFSGYGLTKSAGSMRIDWRFIAKRILNVYVPYLVIVVLIELLSGGFASTEEVLNLFYGQNFWYMTVLFSFYLAFMAIWLIFTNRHIRGGLMIGFTWWYSHYLYVSGEQDFWYISNIAFAIGTLLALYEPEIKKGMDKVGIWLTILFGLGSLAVVYSALHMEHVWADPLEEIRSRIIAVTIFVLFVASLGAVWKWYDRILQFIGKYSIYLYLWHTFLFMWAVNYFTHEMWIRFVIAAGVILSVSIVMGIGMELILKPINKWINTVMKKEQRKTEV